MISLCHRMFEAFWAPSLCGQPEARTRLKVVVKDATLGIPNGVRQNSATTAFMLCMQRARCTGSSNAAPRSWRGDRLLVCKFSA